MNRAHTTQIKAVIFDVDNTLLATNRAIVKGVRMAVARLNEIEKIPITLPNDEMIAAAVRKNLAFENIFIELFPGELFGTPKATYVLENYRTHAAELIYEPISGAIQTVSQLVASGIVVGLVTNRVALLENRLTEAGFDISLFAFICSPAHSNFSKPHPQAFDDAIAHVAARGIKTAETLMCGDHIDDYYSAHARDLEFVAIAHDEQSKKIFRDVGLAEPLILNSLVGAENIMATVVMLRQYKYSLHATSAIDGRHRLLTQSLQYYFSESAFYQYRVQVEIEHIIALSEFYNGTIIRPLSGEEKKQLRLLYQNFSENEAFEILQYDHLGRNGVGPLEHDTKAVEMWIAEKIANTSLNDIISFVHIFLTSEDVINIAQKMAITDSINEQIIPKIYQLTDVLADLAVRYAHDPVMGRTHFQPASPTTFGKIFATYLSRLTDGLDRLHSIECTIKINGAVGSYNSFMASYPEINWVDYSQEFSRRFNCGVSLWTEQRGTQNDTVRVFQALQEINNIVRDSAQDISLYAGLKTLYFTKIASHVGSSVMPHKINPWFAEVTEGNCKKVNALINGLSNDLDVSRLQRDLSDHDWGRSYGEIIGYFLVALEHLNQAFTMIHPDVEYAKKELLENPQIVSEAVQTILRTHEVPHAYTLVKDLTRGTQFTSNEWTDFIEQLSVSELVKKQLRSVSNPCAYVGASAVLAHSAVQKYQNFRHSVVNRKYLSKISE